MKIFALITDGYGGYGGISLYTRQLLDSICRIKSLRQIVVIPRVSPVFNEPVPDKIRYCSNAAKNDFQYLIYLAGFGLVKPKADLVVCSHINLLIFSVFIKKLNGSRLLLILYGVEAWSKPRKLLVSWCLNQVDHVTAISKVTLDRFSSWSNYPQSQTSVIHNGIDLSEFGMAEKSRNLIDRYGISDKKVILTVGRLDAEEQAKGFDQIIRVLPRLLQHNPGIRYLIVGSGSDTDRLKSLAKELNVDYAVIFAGQIDEHEKADHYRLSDVYAMPSTSEGFGYVFLEAMACGIPVVGSGIDGGRDALIDGKLGELVDPDNLDQIYDAVVAAFKKPKQIPVALENFSIESFRKKYQHLIASLTG